VNEEGTPVVTIPEITDEQREDLAAFGYVVFRGLFSGAEIERYAQSMEDILRRKRGGEFEGRRSERITPLVDEDPKTFTSLLDDPRVLAVADGLLGADCLYTGSNDGNLYVGHTPWHIDGGSPHAPLLLKLAFYADSVGEGSGCLSVLPGSHHDDYFQALHRRFYERRTLDLHQCAIPGRTPLPSEPGDVIAFDHRLWHSSWGGRSGRRQFGMSFAAYPRLSWEETWLHGYLARINRRHGKRMLSDSLLQTAGPHRRRKLAKLYDMGL
jgi:ectoine hydroxylase-related dioxygenase (phytanoyl-CoA dioxygenase family)